MPPVSRLPLDDVAVRKSAVGCPFATGVSTGCKLSPLPVGVAPSAGEVGAVPTFPLAVDAGEPVAGFGLGVFKFSIPVALGIGVAVGVAVGVGATVGVSIVSALGKAVAVVMPGCRANAGAGTGVRAGVSSPSANAQSITVRLLAKTAAKSVPRPFAS